MSKRSEYEKKTTERILPILEKKGFFLYDVEYVREGGDNVLCAYIDKEGGITIDDCVEVSREMNPILDEEEYITEPYTFVVSSPGVDRKIRTDAHLEMALGKDIDVKLYKAVDKEKTFTGELLSYDEDSVTIRTEKEERTFLRSDIAKMNQTVHF